MAAPASQPATGPAARTIADIKTLEELQSVEAIHVDKRWAVRVGLADGGADAGPWKLLNCLADFPPEKNAEPALPPPASELSGAMGSLGPVMFSVDDPAVLQKSLQPAAGDVMTESGLIYCAAIPTAWKGAYRIRIWTWNKQLLAERVISVDQPVPNYWQDLVGSELYLLVGKNLIQPENIGLLRHLRESCADGSLADTRTSPGRCRAEIAPKLAPGDPGSATPTARAEPKSQASTPDAAGSGPLGLAFASLGRMEDPASLRPTQHRHPMASDGISTLLAMEKPSSQTWQEN